MARGVLPRVSWRSVVAVMFALLAVAGPVLAAGALPPDLGKLKIKDLQALIDERGLECKACAEKADYVSLLQKYDADPSAFPAKSAEEPAKPKAAEPKAKPAAKPKADKADMSKPAASFDSKSDDGIGDIMAKMKAAGLGNVEMFRREDMDKMQAEMKQKEAFHAKNKGKRKPAPVDDDDGDEPEEL